MNAPYMTIHKSIKSDSYSITIVTLNTQYSITIISIYKCVDVCMCRLNLNHDIAHLLPTVNAYVPNN